MKYKGYELLKAIADGNIKEGTRLQVGTFMWQVDELLEILKEE